MSTSKQSIVIIGAGVSGLAAAEELIRSSVQVTVLEARDRIGGRIHTIRHRDSNFPVELGAEFIHGKAPEILNAAAKFGFPFADVLTRHWFLRNGIFYDTGDFFSVLNQ